MPTGTSEFSALDSAGSAHFPEIVNTIATIAVDAERTRR
jgi:hypothetical protein